MESSSHLIISAAVHYRDEDLRVFLRSAARNVPGASVVLLSENDGEDFRRRLEADNPAVRLLRPPGIERRLRLWRSARRRRRLTRIRGARGRLNALMLATPFWGRASAPLHVVMARHFWADWALKQPFAQAARKFLVCDCRDVCFQADPFEGLNSELVVSCQGTRFREHPRGMGWIRRRYPEPMAGGLKEKPVISAGAMIGTRDGLRNYLAAIKREIRRLAPTLYGRAGDQRIHNVVLHELYDGAREILPLVNPRMVHLYGARREDFILDRDGLKTPEGRLIALLHLYEEMPELEEQIAQTFGARSGVKTNLRTG